MTACAPRRLFEFSVGQKDLVMNNHEQLGVQPHPARRGTLVTEYYRHEPLLFMRLYWRVLGGPRGRTNERGMRITPERMKAVLEARR